MSDRLQPGPPPPTNQPQGGAMPSPATASPAAQGAAALVGALAKAARAFTLYDPSNALVRQFIGEYRARAEGATAAGPVRLDVRPFELALGTEVVYREEDRERSLAFRLFRDGVRQVTFAQGAAFEELLQLLQILVVRYSGVRQAEDDVVTLLRKAQFRTIDVRAVEGYAPDEQEPEEGIRQRGGEAPAGFDTPFPKLPTPGPIVFRQVPEEALAALRAEEAPDALPHAALRLAAELLVWAGRGALPASEVTLFCAELREFLVADHQLGLLSMLAALAERQPAGPLRDELLRGLADPRLLEVLLAELRPGAAELPPAAARLVPLVPAGAILDRIAGEESEERRATLLELAVARLPADVDAVVARLAALPPAAARTLLRAVCERAPARAEDGALALLGHGDLAVQVEALRALAASHHRVPAAPMVKLLGAEAEELRIAAAQALERHGDGPAARVVAEALTGRGPSSREEAAALGRALGVLNAGAALRLFEGWLEARRGLFGANERDELLRWAAVAGLGAIPGPEAEQRLESAAKKAGDALRRHCHATLARRRVEGRSRG